MSIVHVNIPAFAVDGIGCDPVRRSSGSPPMESDDVGSGRDAVLHFARQHSANRPVGDLLGLQQEARFAGILHLLVGGINLGTPSDPDFEIGSWAFVSPQNRDLIKSYLYQVWQPVRIE